MNLNQEDAAVLSAVHHVQSSTGFGRVVVEIKDGRVRIIEISTTVLIKRADEKKKTGLDNDERDRI